jgi:hypothetical protein
MRLLSWPWTASNDPPTDSLRGGDDDDDGGNDDGNEGPVGNMRVGVDFARRRLASADGGDGDDVGRDVQPLAARSSGSSPIDAAGSSDEKKGFSCPAVPYTRKGALVVLSDQHCIDTNFAKLDDGFTMGSTGDEISMASGTPPRIDLRLKYKGVLPVPIVLHQPVPTPPPVGPTPIPQGPTPPPTPSPYNVTRGLYKGTSTFMSFHIQGSMKIRPTSLDMHIAIVIEGPPIFNVTCPGEAYVALVSTISLSTFNDPDDCVGKNMREKALSIDSIVYSNVDKTIMVHIK